MRISFELVALADAKLFYKTLDVELALEQYYVLLEICGWSVQDYEKELYLRIDKEWDLIHRNFVECLSN